MADGLYILDPQKGFNHESVSAVFPAILDFQKDFPGHTLISKFINNLEGNFVTQLDWMRFSGPEDTNLLDGFGELEAHVFEHTTYSCMGKEVINFIEQTEIDRLFIVGVFTDVCVTMTALESFDLGLTTYVISDLVGTLHGQHVHDGELKTLDLAIGTNHVITASQVKSLFAKS